VQGLLKALRKQEAQYDKKRVNAARGRDEHGRAPFFESLLPNSRGSLSPLGGVAKPASEKAR
jgi:hypothetical protein